MIYGRNWRTGCATTATVAGLRSAVTTRSAGTTGRRLSTSAERTSTRRTPPWQRFTLADRFDELAERYGDRPLAMTATRDRSHREVAWEVDRTAAGLLALGVRRREHVAMTMPTTRSTSSTPAEVPTTASGKVQKFRLRERAIAELGLAAVQERMTVRGRFESAHR